MRRKAKAREKQFPNTSQKALDVIDWCQTRTHHPERPRRLRRDSTGCRRRQTTARRRRQGLRSRSRRSPHRGQFCPLHKATKHHGTAQACLVLACVVEDHKAKACFKPAAKHNAKTKQKQKQKQKQKKHLSPSPSPPLSRHSTFKKQKTKRCCRCMCRTSHGLCALARDGAQLVLIPLLALALNVPLLLLAAPRFLREPPLPPGVERLHLGIRLVHCSREREGG